MSEVADRLIVALDQASLLEASLLAERVMPYCRRFKIRVPLLAAEGRIKINVLGLPHLMVDAKCHDVPTSVAQDVTSFLPLGPWAITVHASGGYKMVEAARRAAETSGEGRPLILAVTLLTSLSLDDLRDGLAFGGDPADLVRALAHRALSAGADGFVCSPSMVKDLRKFVGPNVPLVTPGIRETDEDHADHADPLSARGAVQAGADFVVVGRPISQATSPAEVARRISRDLNAAEPGGSGGGN